MQVSLTAVPFLTLIALGIVALVVSVFLRALVDRRIELARREVDRLHQEGSENIAEPFWVRYGEPVKSSIHWLAWTLVGLGVLNLISYSLAGLAERLSEQNDFSFAVKIADDVQRLGIWIRQGADILLRIVIVCVAGVWAARFFHGAMRGLLNGSTVSRRQQEHPRGRARTETLLTTSGYVINVSVFVVCLLMILQMMGVSVAPLLATAGVASVAIGFGAQSLVRDLLAGFFILFEDQFAVGDVVTIDSRSGLVESLTLRCTKLRLSDGALLVIPNGEIKRVENSTSGFSQIDFRIAVQFGGQLDKARQILADEVGRLAKEFSGEVLTAPELLGFDSVKDSSVVLRAKIKTRAGRQFALERELNHRVLGRFIEEQILLPSNK